LTGVLAKSLVFLEFWLGVKKLWKLAISFKNFQNGALVLLEFWKPFEKLTFYCIFLFQISEASPQYFGKKF
jgi:hypothetical protein